ncbi:dTDP-4-dehydrorhamnose reductase [Pseudomonas sp. UBA6310]|uniref:dTDP-4-dehydrorhamnose reductase n=1 Tax=Pseudomonas sp. UBA6310 TaxID=1947327 RepID=UPI00257FB4CA|nr:dTDP-4-dehydrorhamnose reductase [Pseudomonas sp. UBA6310]
MRILVTGRNGQVAQALQRSLAPLGELSVLGSEQLDLQDVDAIRREVRALRPALIVNAAAHTAVDLAQSEPDKAFAINATAPGVLAEEAAALGAALIHYSTDYVFDGAKPAPYLESDAPNPLGVYGQSKLAGERAIQAVGGEHLILRTSWVYSTQGRNFLLTMQKLLAERDELKVVDDQIGAPTWADSIAEATAALVRRWQAGTPGSWGLYHFSAGGETSWFGFAQAIAAHLAAQNRLRARLLPIPSSDYPTPAPRPLNSRLDCTRLQREWDVSLPDWRAALAQCLADSPT